MMTFQVPHSRPTRPLFGRPSTWAAGAALVVLFGILGSRPGATQENAPAPAAPPLTPVAPVQSRTVADTRDYTGIFEAIERTEVRARVGGQVDAVLFADGQFVRPGTPLFRLDPRPYQATLARALSERDRLASELQLAEQEVERGERLVARSAIPVEEQERRRSQRDAMRASLAAAEAAVSLARLDLGFTTIAAPIAGRASRAAVTAGNVVGAAPASPVLTTIVSTDPIYVVFDIDERTVLRHRSRGAQWSVRLTLADGSVHPGSGRVTFLDNEVGAGAGTIRARARIANPDGRLVPGGSARVSLALGERTALLVPDAAIGTDQGQRFALVVREDNTVEYRPLTPGRMAGGFRIVEDGLRAGERVVINGLMRVRPGMTVTPVEQAAEVRP